MAARILMVVYVVLLSVHANCSGYTLKSYPQSTATAELRKLTDGCENNSRKEYATLPRTSESHSPGGSSMITGEYFGLT